MRQGLFSFPNLLKFHRACGGFPLNLDPSNPTTVENDSQLRMFRPTLVGLATVTMYILIYWETYRSYGLDFDTVTQMAEAFGTSVFQLYMVMGLSAMVMITSVVTLLTYIYKRKEICELYGQINFMDKRLRMKPLRDLGSCKLGLKKIIVWTICYILVVFIGWPLYSWASYLAYKDSEPYSPATWATYAFIGIIGFDRCWCLCNPMVSSKTLLCLDAIAALVDINKAWRELTSQLNQSSNVSQEALKGHIIVGRQIYNLIKKANDTLSPFITLFYTYFLFGGILYLYGTCDILFTKGNIKVQAIMLSWVFGIFAFVWLSALAMLSHVGERLKEEADMARDSFDNLFIDHYDESMSVTLRNGWTGISNRLAKISISPYGYFEVHNSGLLATVATVLTYLIIVLQFRAS